MSSDRNDSTWRRIREGTQSIDPLLVRERAIDAIRSFFKTRDFREIETPLLVRHPGMEPHLDVFETRLSTASGRVTAGFLNTSPEYAMKKVLAAGLPRIFQICKSFRNREESSRLHNPEFTILEWYRANAGYLDVMVDCEELICEMVNGISNRDVGRQTGSLQSSLNPMTLEYGDQRIDLTRPWPRLSVREAFQRYTGIDLDRTMDLESMSIAAMASGYSVDCTTTWEQIYHQIFLNEIEPHLGRGRPTILYDYPASMAALARVKPDDARYAERFELYIAGIELGNAFSELVDAGEQRRRLESEREERRETGRTLYDLDDDFIDALAAGIPPSAGIAVGVDRLIMLLANVASIRDVLWFPADEIFGLSSDVLDM